MALSPQRQKLAEQIAKLARLHRERDMLQAAKTPAWEAWRDAQAELEQAQANVEKITREAVDHRIAALAGHGDEPPPSVERARQAVRICEDQLAAARAAEAEIETRSRSVEPAISLAQSNVTREARTVLWSEAPIRAIVDEARAAQQAYVQAAARAKFVHDQVPGHYPADNADAAALRSLVWELETPPLDWRSARGGPDAAEHWKAALAALQADPNAKLPR